MSDLRWYRIDHFVTFGETSGAGSVYFANLIRWQGECRERFGYEHCPQYMRALAGELTMHTSSVSCEYLSEIHAADQISIRLSIPWIRLHLMKGDFAFYRAAPRTEPVLVARGQQLWANAYRNSDPPAAAPWPREVINACSRFGTDLSRAFIQPA
jgi:acyl-CoA thioesterase FadM